MKLLLTLFCIYIIAYSIYYVVLAAVSTKQQRKFRDKYTSKDSNLCVVLYATGECKTLENLIKQLKNQNYPKQNYTIYVILDKCENISEVTLQTESNVNVISVNNMEPIGRSQAYSIIAEKLQEVNDLDAYVFLNANNYVDSTFLESVNFYLTMYSVFNPMINYLAEEGTLNFWQSIKEIYSRFCYKFIWISRTRLSLTNIINTDAFVIKRDLLNKIASFDFRDLMSEVNYTYKLAKEGEIVGSIDDLKVFTSIDNFDFRVPSLSKRFELLTSEFFKANTFKAKEFLLSLAAPNWLVFILGYFILLKHSYIFTLYFFEYSYVLISALVLMIAFCISMMNVKFYPKECLHLFLYPLLSFGKMMYNLPPVRGIRSLITKTTHKPVIEKMTVNVIVSDGKRDFSCELELISEDGLARVTFINNGKKYTTKNNHLRMIDAVRELTNKLADYGLILKACQCCKYFQPVVDGSTNMVKGCCNCQFQGRTPGDIIPTLIWNTCPQFEQHNVVNLF